MSTTQPIRDTGKLENFKNYYRTIKPNPRNYALIIIGLNTALRISDILCLTCGDVFDFNQRRFHTHMTVREQKTGKRNQVYINDAIQDALRAYIPFDKQTENAWIFESKGQQGKPLSRYQAYRIIREAAEYAGLDEHISCHSLRKTFGYYAWKQGTPPALLMTIYNHSTYQITKRYLGIEQDDKDDVYRNIKI
ncbi:MAG: tyrosine-type recombinase/integrase [Lachnospiraceae bacterium]|nr:tyrosine-type recombinase/integrase [Lachnospiraceae bacterium]